MPRFEKLSEAIDSDREDNVIREIYANMPKRNFSSDLLQLGPEHVLVVKLENICWSDWGNRDRVLHSLQHIKSQNRFSALQMQSAAEPIN
jgi:hypothetical protein